MVAAAGSSYTKTLLISLTGQKRAATAPAGGQGEKVAKRAKATTAAATTAVKEKKERAVFADEWCSACLKKGHPA